jgi:hypothetical protein
MTGRDTPAQDRTRDGMRKQVTHAIQDALTGSRALGVLLSLALVVVAGLLAPGETPGVWAWTRVLLAWLLAAVALSSIAGTPHESGEVSRISPLLVWSSLLLAVVVSLTSTTLAATLAVIMLLVSLFNLRSGNAPQPAVFWLFTAVLTPLWVWSAFEAWNQWLLMLIPIGAVGLVALEHAIRATQIANGHPERLAGWIAIVGIGAMLLIAALLFGIPPGWVATAAITAVILAALDVVVAHRIASNRVPTVTLAVVALLSLAVGWLVAL